MQRLPRIGVLMLGYAIGVFARMGVLAKIDLAWNGAAEIDQCQPERPADGGIGAPARTEYAIAVVEPELLDDGPIDDEKRGAGMGRLPGDRPAGTPPSPH
jgi:hypothetical protein